MDEDSFTYEPRDKSGPMDIDSSYDTSRLDAFNLVGIGSSEDGHARKRFHSELARAIPFSPNPTSGFAQFTNPSSNSAPLLLAALNTPRKAPSYDPSQWYNTAPRTPATSSLGTSLANQGDIDMDSPARGLGTPLKSTETPLKGKEAKVEDEVDKENHMEADEGKEEEKSGGEPRKFAKSAVTRTNRKREKAKKQQLQQSQYEDGVSIRHSDSSTPTYSKSEHHYNVHMTPPALRHSEVPALLLGYLQFGVNASIVLFCLYLGIQFVLTVRRDVKDKMQEHSVEILQEIAECTNLYLTNRCDPTLRVPAMEAPCKAWDACMNRDPTMVGRINIIAETFAGVINSFVDPISWKTMSFTLVTLSFLIILTNSALFNLRAKATHHHETPTPNNNFWPPQSHFMPQLPPHMPHPQHHMLPAQAHHSQIPDTRYGIGNETDNANARQIGWSGEEKKKGWW
ncbi:uncharacterized protein I303_108413 [Kwoniella dejecticola CBS 10117]|uniref:Nuclear membrane protein n=1 Tax=Kwoniella dejecticola CBS 10117 TaxID=1296121 RepID=A0A1A5ZXG7_9TREE|nr:nuclear membrane protein [Kwoniella dejecticola CBS 10117]OBR82500.1 nuclear membrane protein [Kwoniella dejecticola CBS 10117]